MITDFIQRKELKEVAQKKTKRKFIFTKSTNSNGKFSFYNLNEI